MEKNKDVLEIIRSHHNILRKSILILKNHQQSPKERRKHLLQFMEILNAHSKAEEITLYRTMKDLGKLSIDADECIEEHKIATQLSGELRSLLQAYWWTNSIGAKAKVLAELIENHLEDEEARYFFQVRSELSLTALEELGRQYLEAFRGEIQFATQKAPASYAVTTQSQIH